MATFKYGNVLMTDRPAGDALAARAIENVGNIPTVAHSDIAANEAGAVAWRGGVYEMVTVAAWSAGDKVYHTGLAAAAAGTHFGYAVAASTDGDTRVLVEHNPDGTSV